MACKKFSEVKNFIQKFHIEYSILLFYGNNYGLVAHNAESYIKLMAENLKIDLNDEFAIIKFYPENLPSLLNEVKTKSFINATKILWIKEVNTNFNNILKEVLNLNLIDTYIIIEAKELTPKANLRNLIEENKLTMALPCLLDNDGSVGEYLYNLVKLYNLQINNDLKKFLLSSLSNDFLLAKSELNKLCLYCADKKNIDIEDIQQICNINDEWDLYKIIDYMLQGKLFKLNKAFKLYLQNGKNSQLLLNIAIRQFKDIQIFKYKTTSENQNIDFLIKNAKPPIHFKRQLIFKNILSIWRIEAINRALIYLQTQATAARINPKMQDVIVHNAILKIVRYVK